MNAKILFASVFCAVLLLSGCGGRSASYRYKLTLSLNTPDGVKTGYNVVELDYFDVSIPARGTMHNTHGQGIYIDLGPKRRPLIALLMRVPKADDPWPCGDCWQEDAPTVVIGSACPAASSANALPYIEQIARLGRQCDRPIPLALPPIPTKLPDLVTFTNVNDPQSILLVNPDNLEATLGPGVSWRSITIQTTDEPLTTGIEKHLPWVWQDQKNVSPSVWEHHDIIMRLDNLNASIHSRGNVIGTADFARE